jgi:hypothetical protein
MQSKELPMTQSQLAKKVEELAKELNEVKRQVARIQGKPLSSRDFIGMFHGDKYFKEAMELGAEYRRSQNPYRKPARKRKR